MHRRTTIKDIALAAGVSPSAVSIVLNGKDHRISEETRARVIHMANELGYAPRQPAVSLKAQKSYALGLVVPDVSNVFFADIAKGAEKQASLSGYTILLYNSNDQASCDVTYVNLLLNCHVDGIPLAASCPQQGNENAACKKLLALSQVPAVLIDRTLLDDTTSSVMVDHKQGGYLATKHLLDKGHRRIGCITGPLRLYSALLRYQGFLQALEECGVTCDIRLVEHGQYHMEDGEVCAARLIRQGATAIFSYNDLMAYGVYRYAKSQGIPIPGSLSVVGFDDLKSSSMLDPALTTIGQNAQVIGAMAVRKLIALIETGGEINETLCVKPELVIRGSTAVCAT